MTKKEMAKRIAAELGMTEVKAKAVIQVTLDAIVEAIGEDGRIELRNFGVFQVRERKDRMGRNPRTGAQVRIPGKRVVVFKPGKEMAQRILKMGRSGMGTAKIRGLEA